MDSLILRKRFIIETIFNQLRNIFQIEHSQYRSYINCMVNLLAGRYTRIFHIMANPTKLR
ncbi:hypothetical protein BTN49_1205 [Candidatus Enterovibrio escicola]|uniref:Transposase DDE domain-containing protein n=1 Tax=Candidatus Enterovibrio escicola TaxID=1927127 RepID=A0A2A5T4V5_9GAMM|nr:hypothetical protein BTN49_1205 [Candidatus Enterovibrio escacola]